MFGKIMDTTLNAFKSFQKPFKKTTKIYFSISYVCSALDGIFPIVFFLSLFFRKKNRLWITLANINGFFFPDLCMNYSYSWLAFRQSISTKGARIRSDGTSRQTMALLLFWRDSLRDDLACSCRLSDDFFTSGSASVFIAGPRYDMLKM
ncbi:hypothetical protein CIH92_25595 [Salmonella enterica]|nr:hypothetical protein [Salmonella enterica]EEG7825239.1 hypothetical protein [Salmonella enterica]EGW1221520.1 hypothetical protein [Salmonella enterica]